ncbi:hypothetical protein MMC07_006764 [Pseudocyphellaria aurata]|nr:hypothetical protein [Pseudocyphellaria aurata]
MPESDSSDGAPNPPSPRPSGASSSGNSPGAEQSTSESPPQPSPTAVQMTPTLAHQPSLTGGNSHLTGSEPDIDNPHISRARSDTVGNFQQSLAIYATHDYEFHQTTGPIPRFSTHDYEFHQTTGPIPRFSPRLEGIDPSESGREFEIFEEIFEDDRGSGPRPEDFETVDTIMARLPPVDTASLGEREQSCPVCLNGYNHPGSATSSGPSETEHAVRLPCHHVIGRECIRQWLEDGNITCPLCRANVHGP